MVDGFVALGNSFFLFPQHRLRKRVKSTSSASSAGRRRLPMGDATVRRCAIYTRKSSEEGLEQDYNSLHAQREACEAFVRSQAGEGWKLIRTAYDDGGFSGGTMERPALQHLLEDIRRRLVDVV